MQDPIDELLDESRPDDRWYSAFNRGIARAFRRLPGIIPEALPYTIVGVAVGLALLYFSRVFVPTTLRHEVLSGLAAGFFVSSISVLFYEWSAHIKQALRLSDRLCWFLKDGNAYVDHGVRGVLGSKNANLIEYQRQFLNAIKALDQSRDFYKDGYINFLTRFMLVTARNAESLQRLSSDLALHPTDVRPYELDIPGPEIFADDMLTEQMKRLNEGDEYVTFSNPETWHVPLKKFRDAGVDAAKRNVRIRRLIVLGNKYQPQDTRELAEHYSKFRQHPDRYQIRIADENYVRHLLGRSSRPHYGIFVHKDEEKTAGAVFEVVGEPTLRKFRLITGVIEGTDTSSSELKSKLEEFDKVWDHCEHDTPIGVRHFVDMMLARDIEHTKGIYCAVTDTARTPPDDLTRTAEAIQSQKDLSVRRVVVVGAGDGPDHTLIKRYMKEAAATPSRYEVRWLAQNEAEPPLTYSFLVSSEGEKEKEHLDVFNECWGDDGGDFVQRDMAFFYKEKFEKLWERAKPAV